MLTPAEVGDTFHVAEPEGKSVTRSAASPFLKLASNEAVKLAMPPHGGTHPSAPRTGLTVGHQLQIALTERIVDLGGTVHGDTQAWQIRRIEAGGIIQFCVGNAAGDQQSRQG